MQLEESRTSTWHKQFIKGISQIALEGAIQIFQEFNTGMEEIIVGVVGVLQFDVLKFRLENEYNVDAMPRKLELNNLFFRLQHAPPDQKTMHSPHTLRTLWYSHVFPLYHLQYV